MPSNISSSAVLFSCCLQSLLTSESFLSQLFISGGQSIGTFSFRISPSNEYSGLIFFRIDWFDLLQSKGLSWVFSNTTVQKHQFFGAQLSSQSNSHSHTWPLGRHSLLPSPVWPLPICLDSWTWHSRFLCNIAIYSIRPCFYRQSHPQLGILFALTPSLHSFWSYFSTDFQ